MDKIPPWRLILIVAFSAISWMPGCATDTEIVGRVSWIGKRPQHKELSVRSLPATERPSHTIYDETLLVSDDNGIQNVVVYLVGEEIVGKTQRTESRQIEFSPGQIIPHITAFQAGDVVELLNSDSSDWLLYLNDDNTRELLVKLHLLPSHIQVLPDRMQNTPIKITDVIRPWPSAYIWKFDHPYFAITNKDGFFCIKNPPAGKYKLIFWHEMMDVKEVPVIVKKNAHAEVNIQFGSDDK